jgi:hypothetical protein
MYLSSIRHVTLLNGVEHNMFFLGQQENRHFV